MADRGNRSSSKSPPPQMRLSNPPSVSLNPTASYATIDALLAKLTSPQLSKPKSSSHAPASTSASKGSLKALSVRLPVETLAPRSSASATALSEEKKADGDFPNTNNQSTSPSGSPNSSPNGRTGPSYDATTHAVPISPSISLDIYHPLVPFPISSLFERNSSYRLKEMDLSTWCPTFDEHTVLSMVNANDGLRTITFDHTPPLTDEALRLVLHYYCAKAGACTRLSVRSPPLLSSDFVRTSLIKSGCAPYLVSLHLVNCGLDDKSLKNLAKNLLKVRELHIADNPSISDEGILQLTRANKALTSLDVSGLVRLTDFSLKNIADSESELSYLDVSHAAKVTHEGLLLVLLGLKNLTTLHLKNLPNVTDETLRLLAETPVVYGFRPHHNFSFLKKLSLADIPAITDNSLSYLFKALTAVRGVTTPATLDTLLINRCPLIGSDETAYANLGSVLVDLVSLDLRECPSFTDKALKALLLTAQHKKLTSLNVTACALLTDDSIASLGKMCKNLRDLSLGGQQHVTDEAVHQVVKSCSKLQKLYATNMRRLTNKSVASIARKALGLRDLDLSLCRQITDEGLKTLCNLRALQTLSLAENFLLTDAAAELLSQTSLTSLDLSNVKKLTDAAARSLATRLPNLRVVVLRGNYNLTVAGSVDVLLKSLQKLERLDVADIEAINPASLPALIAKYPLHQYMAVDPLASIAYIPPDGLKRREQMEHARYSFRLLHSAKVVQAGWRAYVIYRKKSAQRKAAFRKKVRQAIKIQSQVRRVLAPPKVEAVRRAKHYVQLMLMARFILRKLRRRNAKADVHLKKKLTRRYFKLIVANTAEELEAKRLALERIKETTAEEHFDKVLSKKMFKHYKRLYEQLKHEKHKDAFANAHWGKIVLPDLIRTWKSKTKIRRENRIKKAAVFMYIANVETHNSFRQLSKVKLAKDFWRANLLCLVWRGMRRFFDEFSVTLQKAKVAQAHAKEKFKKKMYTAIFSALHKYAKQRIYSRYLKKKGDYWCIKRKKRVAQKRLYCYAKEQIKYRLDLKRALDLLRSTTLRRCFLITAKYKNHRKRQYMRKRKGVAHHSFRTKAVWAAWWMDWTIRFIDWKRKTKIARDHFNSKIRRKVYKSWAMYAKNAGDLKALAAAKQALILKAKTFSEWRRFWKEASAQKRAAEELAKQDASARQRLYDASTNISRIWLGFSSRRETDNQRTFRDWAVLKCQTIYRRWHALKEVRKKIRMRALKANLVEEKVEEEMALEEKYMRWWMKMEKNAILLKRILMGHRGRVLAYKRRQQRFVEKGIEFQDEKNKGLKFWQDRLVLRERLRVLKNSSCISIQKTFRGLLGRRRHKAILQAKREREIASKVQAAFRGKQGRRRADARRRLKVNDARIKQARQIQAKALRKYGFKQRKHQRNMIRVLRAIGLESMTFVQHWFQQVGEIKQDMEAVRTAVSVNYEVWRSAGFDEYLRHKTRRALESKVADKMKPEVSNAVRIIQPRHKYTGLTGLVIQVDRSNSAKPVAEVRMDVDGTIQYYMFITESTMYDPPQPALYTIPTLSNKGVKYPEVKNCTEHLLSWAAEERIKRTRFKAARLIQSLARMYLSRVRVSKIRYYYWSKLRSDRLALLHAMETYGAANVQAARILLSLGFVRGAAVPLLDEFPAVPPRVEEKRNNLQMRGLINAEFLAKQRRRHAFVVVNAARMREGSFAMRQRPYSTANKAAHDFFSQVAKYSTSAVAERVNSGGSKGGILERMAMFFGGKEWKRTQDERHSWLKRVVCRQFAKSPHVRMQGLSLYHGVVKGSPFSKLKNPVVPHGEGFLEFLQGYGVGKEEKTLHVRVIKATDLRAADFNNSDPFVEIHCNRRILKTKVKEATLDPVWDEKFEIDVTDPYHVIKIVVMDWDRFSSNDFLGQFIFPIADLADGKKVSKSYKLIPEEKTKRDQAKMTKKQIEDENDLGEIELELQWVPRADSDDIDRVRLQNKNIIILQCWARQIFSRWEVAKEKARAKRKLLLLSSTATKIQCAYRFYRSRKYLKSVKMIRKTMIRIQCAARQWRARRKTNKARLQFFASRTIQCIMRKCYAKMIRAELFRIRSFLRDECACAIQRMVRLRVSRILIQKTRKKKENHPTKKQCIETFNSWIDTYGTDPNYPSKRLRRMCLKTFARVLSVKGSTIVTKYGDARVEMFPAPYVDERAGEDFVYSNLYSHRRLSAPAAERKALRDSSPKYPLFVKVSAVLIRETVDLRVVPIQCLFRIAIAKTRVKAKFKVAKAAILVQRMYRWRFQKKAKLALMVQCTWRRYRAYKELKFRKLEVICAKKIQNNLRCFFGRLKLEERRRCRKAEVFDSSGDLNQLFDASKTLDGQPNTFWCSPPKDVSSQWIIYDLGKKLPIGKVKLKTPDNTSAPKEIVVECANRNNGPWKVIANILLKQQSEKKKEQSFDLPKTISRFWRLSITRNFGNAQAVAIISVGFFIAREVTAQVVNHPKSVKVSPGPPVGRVGGEIVLRCSAQGWPVPAYQWLLNGEVMPGEVGDSLKIVVGSTKKKTLKRFRCIHCKKINTELPENVYRVICSNCKYAYDYPEVDAAAKLRKPILLEIAELDLQVKQLESSKRDLTEDLKAMQNKQKRDDYAAARGEDVNAAAEAKEAKDAEAKKSEEAKAKLTMDGALAGGPRHQPSGGDPMAESKVLKKPYKQVMKEFATLEEDVLALEQEKEPEEEEKPVEDVKVGEKKPEDEMALLAKLGATVDLGAKRDRQKETEKAMKELEDRIAKIEESLAKLERKSSFLLRKRLDAAAFDPCKVTYYGEGVYTCVVSNIRGGTVLRKNSSRPAIIFVDDPVPQKIKVREEYHLKRRLRRRVWPKYLNLYGWFVDGNVTGDVLIRYNEGSVYDGPYVDERWLTWTGRVDDGAYEDDHWGVWLSTNDYVYEGPKVSNHFDVSDIQGEYRITYPNGEVYEGQFVDERQHGIGEYHYLDGAVYEGEWFKGRRQGFGVFTILNGTTYEGEWDRNEIHGEGIWRWADGSTFMGDNIDGHRHGRGVYITAHGDIYVGQFENDKIHGTGVFTYNDGSRYEGPFRKNIREGEAVFTYTSGVKDVGMWRNDKRDGEFIVRRPVKDDDPTSTHVWDDETQLGLWEEGEFVEWMTPAINPKATLQFIKTFEDNNGVEFDGVYAMLIARKLPNVPHGIQESHPKVKAILARIAREGGQLVAADTYETTKAQLAEMEPILEDLRAKYRHDRTEEEHVDVAVASVRREIDEVKRKVNALTEQRKVYDSAIEGFWLEDKTEAREKFFKACKNLESLKRNQWFEIRHYHSPPTLVENVMCAACRLMMLPTTWKSAQNLLGSNVQNRDDGDAEAVWQEYDVKLLFMLKTFDVFDRNTDPGLLSYVGQFLVDPRFKSDNYQLVNLGAAAPLLVEWIWATYLYVKKSMIIKQKYDGLRAVEGAISRFEAIIEQHEEKCNKYNERFSYLRERAQKSMRKKDRWQAKYDKLENLLMKCQEMVTKYESDDDHELDEYERMLAAEGEIKSTTETIMELMIREVESENVQPVPLPGGENALMTIIDDGVSRGRGKMFRVGDYKYSGGKLTIGNKPIDVWETQSKICQEVILQANSLMNENPDQRQWTMLDGKKITSDVFLKTIRTKWTEVDIRDALNAAEMKWANIFPKNTAWMAIQSRTNFIMTDDAKKEAEIWASRHKEEIQWTEEWISSNFAEENHEETAKAALELKDDRRVGMDQMAMATTWCKLNRSAVLAELDRQNKEKAARFQEANPDKTANAALTYKIAPEGSVDAVSMEEAEAWMSLNVELMIQIELEEAKKLAAEFADEFPQETAREAVKIRMNPNAEKVLLERAMTWSTRDENKDLYYKTEQAITLELFREDEAKAQSIKGYQDQVDQWYVASEMRKKRLGIKTDLEKEEDKKKAAKGIEVQVEDERPSSKKGKKSDNDQKEKNAVKKDKKDDKKGGAKSPDKKGGGKEKASPAKKGGKPSPSKGATEPDNDDGGDEGDEAKKSDEALQDEGVVKLAADIEHARRQIVKLTRARVEYNSKRLASLVAREKHLLEDKEYLKVNPRIRPSEAKEELKKQAELRDGRLKFLVKAIKDTQGKLDLSEKILAETQQKINDASGLPEWSEAYWEPTYNCWAYLNNWTGEVQYA